jgi:N-succinyldiaminopimelate aminotransferase
LFELSDRFGFVIASDECYSEIYFRDEPPLGGLEAATLCGRTEFKNLRELSPACPSAAMCPACAAAFVRGDAEWIEQFCSTAPTTAAP